MQQLRKQHGHFVKDFAAQLDKISRLRRADGAVDSGAAIRTQRQKGDLGYRQPEGVAQAVDNGIVGYIGFFEHNRPTDHRSSGKSSTFSPENQTTSSPYDRCCSQLSGSDVSFGGHDI